MAKTKYSKRQRRGFLAAQAAGGPSLHGMAWVRTNGHCWYCGDPLPRDVMTLDHLVPLALGGRHHLDNVVASCKPCNNAKGQLSLTAYRTRCGEKPFWGERT